MHRVFEDYLEIDSSTISKQNASEIEFYRNSKDSLYIAMAQTFNQFSCK